MKAVRVAFVSAHVLSGGAERYLTLLLDALGPSWVERVVFLGEGPLVARLQGRGFPVEVVATSRRAVSVARAARALRRALRAADAELVHADGIKAALVAVLATARLDVPVVWVKHDFSWDGPLVRLVAARCAAVVGVSDAVVAGLRGPNVSVVHNGLPHARVDRAEARARLRTLVGDGRGPLVGLVGRLHPAKGQAELLAVTRELRERHPDLRVVLVGAPDPSQPAYAAAIESGAAGLGDTVRFLGHRDDAADLAAGLDVAVCPSVPDERGMGREGFGFAALEAMAAGTPVAAYADGALPEILGECGLLVPAGDREALRGAILRLLDDGGLRERLARCGRERAATHFSLERTVEALKERYREVKATRATEVTA